MNLLDEDLMHHIANLDPDDAGAWLILAPHPDFKGAWYVDSLDPSFFFDFEDMIGEYRVVFPSGLQEFKQHADELGYHIAFTEDPSNILEAYDALRDPRHFYQFRTSWALYKGSSPGRLKDSTSSLDEMIPEADSASGTQERAKPSLWQWDMYHQQFHDADTILVVVKSNNKRDMQKKLKKLADIDSVILDGYKPIKRIEKYVELDQMDKRVIVMNYEKFREDQPF
jgi:hypothetical protein